MLDVVVVSGGGVVTPLHYDLIVPPKFHRRFLANNQHHAWSQTIGFI
jgi:hypothetical protein